MRVNLASNYTFLNGSTVGWAPENGASMAYTADYAFFGAGSLEVSKGGTNGSGVVMNAPIPVQAGKPYAVSIYSRLPVTIPESEAAEITMTVVWANSLGAVVGTTNTGVMDMTDDSKWYRLSGVWTAPVGATVISAIRVFQPIAGGNGEKFILDALLVEQAAYVGGFFFTYSPEQTYAIAKNALSRVPQVINGLRLGADISINDLTFNTIDEFGTIWIIEDIRGWDGQTAPEMPDIGRGTDDGSYDVEGRLTSRGIIVSGFFIPANGEEALTAAKDRLVESINLVRKGGWLRLHTEPTRAAWVRLSAAPTIETINDRGRTNFAINLRAPDPIKYHWNDQDPEGFSYGSAQSSDVPDMVTTNLATQPSFEVTSGTTEVRRNLVLNPSLTINATGWGPGSVNTGGASSGARQSNGGPLNEPYYRKTWTTAETSAGTSATLDVAATNQAESSVVTGSTTYTVSASFRSGMAETVRIAVVEYDSGGTPTITAGSNQDVVANLWVTLFKVHTTLSTTVAMRIIIQQGGSVLHPISSRWDVTRAMIEPIGKLRPYFDGSTVPRRVNHVSNPRVESTGNWDYSGTWATMPNQIVITDLPGFGYSFGSTVATTTANQNLRYIHNTTVFAVGKTFHVGFWAKVSGSGSGNAYARVSAASTLATPFSGGSQTVVRDGAWHWYGFTVVSTSTVVYTGVSFDAGVTAVSAEITGLYVTEAEAGVSAPTSDAYLDGYTTRDGYQYSWLGTAGLSISFERDLDFTASWLGTTGASISVLTGKALPNTASSAAAVAIQSTHWAALGSYSARIIPNSGTTTDTFFSPGGDSGGIRLGMQPGKTYTALATIRLSAINHGTQDSRARRIRVYTKVGSDSYVTTQSVQAPNEAGETELRVTFSVPPEANEAFIRLYSGAALYDGDVWWDKFALVEGEYTGPYFDGDNVAGPSEEYAWLGTPQSSASVHRVWTSDVITNIGNASVTGIFTITGPAGPGTYIYNAATNERITLAEPLRGAALVGEVIKMSALNGVATLTTEAYSGLRPGDRVSLLGLPIPFTTPGTAYTVLASSDVFPYSFSFEVGTDDIDEVDVSGQVSLIDPDVLVVDTYEKTVTYNGETTGHRYRLVTLTDWLKFGPGDNPIDFLDDALQVPVESKSISGTTATLDTETVHYLRTGDQILVQLPETAELSRKSLTDDVVTITTAEPHGFAVGDKVDVVSVETSIINAKSRTSNSVTLTTVDEHGISVSDFITVSLPVTAVPSQKQLTTNVATITTQNPHGFSVGDTVTVALPATANISNKRLINNIATLTTSGSHGYAVGDTIVVSMPANASISSKAHIGSLAYIETSSPHGFSVGDSVIISLPTSATLTGARSIDGTTNLVTVTTSTPHGFSAGDKVVVSTSLNSSATVTTKSATTTSCTLTVSGTHGWNVGEKITVTGVDSRFNGTFYITAVTSNTVTYDSSGSSVSSIASGGSISNVTVSSYYNGSKVIEGVPTTTTFTYRAWDQTVNTTGTGTTGSVLNVTNQEYNGTKTLVSASGSVFAYNF